MGHRFILVAAICLLAVSCGRPDNSSPIPKSALQGNQKPFVPSADLYGSKGLFSCDTPAEQQKVEAQKSFESSITMVSTYVKVEKVDCDETVIETTVEEAGVPRVLVSVPAPEMSDASKVLGVKITNLRTCKSLVIDRSTNETRTSMEVHMTGPNGAMIPIAPAPLLTKDLSLKFVGEINFMQIGTVVPLSAGVNVVTVSYQDCASCESPKALYTTAMTINVKHEVDKSTMKTVRRSMCRTAN